jgi:signal transduction histidine kinase
MAYLRRDLLFRWVVWCFVFFILACGTTHFMSIWTLWVPDYGLEALIKAITAGASVATAIVLWPLLPRILAVPSPDQMRLANEALALHVQEHAAAVDALRKEAADRQKVEEMLRQAQKMEAVGQLTGGVAHDFNNLLTAILINLDRAKLQSDTQDPKIRKALEMATAAAEKAAGLVDQMLAFARKQPLKPQSLDLNQLLADLEPLLKNILGERAKLAFALGANSGHVWADRNQLEQALLNLAANARDAMPESGTVTIATSKVSPEECGESHPCASIEVADTGCGMEEAVLAHAFEPFFTTKPIGEGSGLGLSQVYGFAQQSGGKVQLKSKIGHGTTVSIRLPVICKA